MSDGSASTVPTNLWHPGGFPRLFERYQILGILGEGGMGTVYKGYHLNLKRFVAIKTLRLDQLKRPDLVHRFLREMEVVGQMDHPNVVRASDAGEKNGVFHLVMEYLTGSDLSGLVAKRGPLKVADACELIRQAALGLAYIHQTLVHRDIKPSNLMLTTAGLVKILDLGLARLHQVEADGREWTPQGCVLGTFDYIAPEQAAANASIDGRADIYSLGCTLFKLLTGRAPFAGAEYESAAKKLFAHCHVPLTAVEAFSSIPKDLQPVLLRMTAKKPAERYPSAHELTRELEPFAAGAGLLQLLERGAGSAESPLRPLPQPLPEELSWLSGIPPQTPMATPSTPARHEGSVHEVPRSVLPAPEPTSSGGWRRILLVAGLLTCAVAVLAWFVVASLLERHSQGDPGEQGQLQASGSPDTLVPQPGRAGQSSGHGPRNLDALELDTYHRLLDEPILPLGHEAEDPRKWRWDRGLQRLESNWRDLLLFPLGTTTRPCFDLEAGIAQAPWTGNVGIFWGYREDAAVKSARTPGQDFAWYQLVVLSLRTGAKGESLYSVLRGRGALRHNENGDVQPNTRFSQRHDIAMLSGDGEKILVISVRHNELRQAVLGSVKLSDLCSEATNKTYEGEPYAGGLGLITLGHHATFSDVRFLAHSRN